VLQRIAQSHQETVVQPDRHDDQGDSAAQVALPAFVSLSRVASGEA